MMRGSVIQARGRENSLFASEVVNNTSLIAQQAEYLTANKVLLAADHPLTALHHRLSASSLSFAAYVNVR